MDGRRPSINFPKRARLLCDGVRASLPTDSPGSRKGSRKNGRAATPQNNSSKRAQVDGTGQGRRRALRGLGRVVSYVRELGAGLAATTPPPTNRAPRRPVVFI